jgi:hypothetical protein
MTAAGGWGEADVFHEESVGIDCSGVKREEVWWCGKCVSLLKV